MHALQHVRQFVLLALIGFGAACGRGAEHSSSTVLKGLRVIAISVDEGDGTRVRRFIDGEHLTMPIAHDPSAMVSRRLSTVGVPESYLIDTTGRLAWHQVGGLHSDPSAARVAITRILGP